MHYWCKFIIYPDLLSFYIMSFFSFMVLIRKPHHIYVCLVSSGLYPFLWPLFFMTMFQKHWSDVAGSYFIGNYLMFSSVLEKIVGFIEEDYKGAVPFSMYHIKVAYCQRALTLLMLTWSPDGEAVLSGFSIVKLLYFPLPILLFGNKSLFAAQI